MRVNKKALRDLLSILADLATIAGLILSLYHYLKPEKSQVAVKAIYPPLLLGVQDEER